MLYECATQAAGFLYKKSCYIKKKDGIGVNCNQIVITEYTR